MNRATITAVLRYRLTDFDDEWPTDDLHEPDDFDFGQCVVELEPLGGDLYRVAIPTPLTPFGPLGGGLTLGQVIEAKPASGPYRAGLVARNDDAVPETALQYVTTHSTPPVWNFGGCVERYILDDPAVARLLRQLRQLGSEWEWAVGNLSIQGLGEEPPEHVRPVLAALTDAVQGARSRRPPGVCASCGHRNRYGSRRCARCGL